MNNGKLISKISYFYLDVFFSGFEGKKFRMDKHRFVIYQLLPRLFGNTKSVNVPNGNIDQNGCGKFNDISKEALISIAGLGATHVWYTGVIEHATCSDFSKYGIAADSPDVVKGQAGSPYAIKDYYDVAPDLAVDVNNRMAEFENLITRTHAAGLKVIIDLVPNHVARNYNSDAAPKGIEPFGKKDNKKVSFAKDNNYYYLPGTTFKPPLQISNEKPWKETPARATGNDCFSPTPSVNDWYETVKLNYGVDYPGDTQVDFEPEPDTWKKMLDIVLYWSQKGVDGFRCDMAGMVPVEFWRWMIGEVRSKFPEMLFIAEIYEADRYQDYIFKGGFDFLYDKVVLYDALRDVMEGKVPASGLTDCWQKTDGLHHFLLYFLENHDEQRLSSDFFMTVGHKAIPGMTVAATMFNNPLLIYFGQELGERGMDEEGFSGRDGRTTIFDYWSLKLIQNWRSNGDWTGADLPKAAAELRSFYQKLLTIIHQKPAFYKGRFYDLMWVNRHESFCHDKIYAFMRYEGGHCFLILANFSDKQQSYKLKIPLDAMDTCGMEKELFYNGIDLLGFNRPLQFPAAVALNGGIGGRLEPYTASIYELKGYVLD
ncbi:alpha-amylase family protein [Natronoflexus pectinivorans]|uniref:alpha-amylase family protein n=1 Tax=Natronoflexus pectinivorans TaxID=682526 RepID=UPI001FB736C7|nr:alpha-amylase family protein [Natronoflexus pectinivorans]